MKKRIAIFASGRGSNAKAILDYFREDDQVEVVLIVSNDPEALVLDLAAEYQIDFLVIDRTCLKTGKLLDDRLVDHEIDLIVLAGFLWLIPVRLINRYPQRIINIHPALLPKYGGKGMYGHHVHQAVKNAGDEASGITIHYVNEHYDQGNHIFQASCHLDPWDTPADIGAKVLKLEHFHYPRIIQKLLKHSKI